MDAETPALMDQVQYAKHRGKTKQYINKLVKAGVLVMRGGKIDVRASDQVLDDKPLPAIDEPPAARTMATVRTPEDGPQKTTYAEARTIRTVFQAKLARLDFETRQGKLIEAEGVRLRISEHMRAIRDGLDGCRTGWPGRLPRRATREKFTR